MFPIDPTGGLDELWKAPRRIHNLIRVAKGEFEPVLEPTPSREVARWGRIRLLAYAPVGEPVRAPLLLVPSIINRHYVLDLRPGASLVEHLTGQGIPVYLIDWGRPNPQDRFMTMADHVLRHLHHAVRKTCRDAGVDRVHLLGYCIGGTLATMYAALRPERVAGLVALTAPIGFRDDGILACWANRGDVPADHFRRAWGNVSGEFLQGSFLLLQPGAQAGKLRSLAENLWDDGFVERYMALEAWVTDNVDVPGDTYRSLIRDLYEGDKLLSGEMELDGERVDLSRIEAPVLVATSAKDHIVPDPSASVLAERVGSRDVTHLDFPGGHIGVVVGSAARRGLWPALTEWLKARPVVPGEGPEAAGLGDGSIS